MGTRDAYMMALDARTGEVVWETRMADYNDGYANSSGPIVADGKVSQRDQRLLALHARQLLRHRPRRGDRGGAVAPAHHRRAGASRAGNFVGRPAAGAAGRRRLVDSPAATTRRWGLLYWPVAQAKPWVPASRGLTVHDPALYTNSTLALDPDDGSIRWFPAARSGEALDLDEGFEQVLIDTGGRRALFTIGKHGILWKIDRESGAFLGHAETVFQNVFERIDPVTGVVTFRQDIADAGIGDWVSVCPQHRRRPQLARHGLQPRRRRTGHPPEPELPGDCRP